MYFHNNLHPQGYILSFAFGVNKKLPQSETSQNAFRGQGQSIQIIYMLKWAYPPNLVM